MTSPGYESIDGREWITEAISKVGGAKRVFRARCLEPRQLEGLFDDESSCENQRKIKNDDGENNGLRYWPRYRDQR